MIRTFLAVELPAALTQAIVQVQADVRNRISRELSPGMRLQWVRPTAIHLTLKFFGDIPEDHVDDLQSVVGDALHSLAPFSIAVAGLGVFPDLRVPRVLWIGLSAGPEESGGNPTTTLSHLDETIERSVEGLGYPPESRPFNPHLTLARIKEGSKEVGRVLARIGLLDVDVQLGQLNVRTVALVQSERRPSGSIYTKLWEVPLGGAGQG
ncbi:MAG: RNA 2',3'-cyclic phosphodiesterase [Nitrospirae bacterium]|nr:MAG: RNA 2',3'-cyclic phosphodiesterase [Nitrospirota bacterium]